MEFKDILQDWQVAGIVVNRPVQKEVWCGYACGKVLFVMDHLHSYSCFVAASSKQQPRTMCLWDRVHHDAPSSKTPAITAVSLLWCCNKSTRAP